MSGRARLPTAPGSVRYRDAGRMMRDVLRRAAACRPRLGSLERAVLNAVLASTTSWSKAQDITTLDGLARDALGVPAPEPLDGRDRRRVREALERLADRGLIGLERTGRGRGSRLHLRVWVAESDAPTAPISKVRNGRGHGHGAAGEMDALSGAEWTRSARRTENREGDHDPGLEELLDQLVMHFGASARAALAAILRDARARLSPETIAEVADRCLTYRPRTPAYVASALAAAEEPPPVESAVPDWMRGPTL